MNRKREPNTNTEKRQRDRELEGRRVRERERGTEMKEIDSQRYVLFYKYDLINITGREEQKKKGRESNSRVIKKSKNVKYQQM